MPRSENTICAIVSPRKDLVRGTNPPTEQSTHTTTDNNMHVVYMARNDLPLTDHYAPSAEKARRLGNVGCISQVQDVPSISHVDIELTRRFGNSVLAGALEPERTNCKPPKPKHNPEQINRCHTLCTKHDICESTRNTETYKKFKRCLYNALLTLANAEKGINNCESPRNTRQSPGHLYGPHYTQPRYLSA